MRIIKKYHIFLIAILSFSVLLGIGYAQISNIDLSIDGTATLANATITVGTLGVEHTRDMSSMVVTSFQVRKTNS